MGGIGAPPTPIVPISSDSIRKVWLCGPIALDSAAAVIQPAVPPPRMPLLLTLFSFTLSSPSTVAKRHRRELPVGVQDLGPSAALPVAALPDKPYSKAVPRWTRRRPLPPLRTVRS